MHHPVKHWIEMIKFIGEHTVKVDDKGRMIFPSQFKSLFDPEAQLRFVIKKDLYANCLQMFTYQEWERESEEVKSRLNFFNEEHALFWRDYMRNRAIVEPDGKLGRISIPKNLLLSIGIDREKGVKEVVFAGNDHKIEIWAKENYEASMMPQSDFVSLAKKILG